MQAEPLEPSADAGEVKTFIRALTETPLKLLSAPAYRPWNASTSLEPVQVAHKRTRCLAARRLWAKIDDLSSSPFIRSEFDAHVQELLESRAAALVRRLRRADLRRQFSAENLIRIEMKARRQMDELTIPPDLEQWRKRTSTSTGAARPPQLSRRARRRPTIKPPAVRAVKAAPSGAILLANCSRPVSSSTRLRRLRPPREDAIVKCRDLKTICERILVRSRTCPQL